MLLLKNYIIDTIRRTEKFFDSPKHDIFFDTSEYLKFTSLFGGSKQSNFNKINARHWMRPNCNKCKNCNGHYAIWINMGSIKTIRRLNMTIVHEVLHIKQSRHTIKFYKTIINTCNALFDGINFNKYTNHDLSPRIRLKL